MWRASVLTLFPEMFPGPLGNSLTGKALRDRLWSLDVRDIREHGIGKHRKVDDSPSGGGPGMVMRTDVAASAIDAVTAEDGAPRPLIYLSPRGAPLTQMPWRRGPESSFSAGASRGSTSAPSRPAPWRKSRWAISSFPAARWRRWP